MIIQSDSQGNAVLYLDSILVDIGVSWKKLAPYKNQIQLVLLTHRHKDHLNIGALKRLQKHNPKLIVAGGEFMKEHLGEIDNIYTLDFGKWYRFGNIDIAPVKLYHDVPNYGYRIFGNNEKIFHATDTSTLEGITAKNYTVYAIEDNYCEVIANKAITTPKCDYEHIYRSIQTHLSSQQRQKFIDDNAGDEYIELKLHKSTRYSVGGTYEREEYES